MKRSAALKQVFSFFRKIANGALRRYGARIVFGMVAIVLVLSGMFSYAVWRLDRVQENIGIVNQFYVPSLTYLNRVRGKWSAYHRSFEKHMAFRRWGKKSFRFRKPKLKLHRVLGRDLNRLAQIVGEFPSSPLVPEKSETLELVSKISEQARTEPATISEIASNVNSKKYKPAAEMYGVLRRNHLEISRNLASLIRRFERRISILQLTTEQELRSAQSEVLFLLVLAISFCLFLLIKFKRWFSPIMDLTRVAQEVSLKGIHGGVKLTQPKHSMPGEVALLTREFNRMARTVLEREMTINQQKERVATLNSHLKEQNERLVQLGSLNESVLNGMSSGLLVLQNDLVEQFNEKFCQMFNVDRKLILGMAAHKVLEPWGKKRIGTWLEATDPLLLQREKLGGSFYDVRVQLLPDQAGKLFMFEDVTSIVKAEEKLAHIKELALAGNMSTQVAHEVRNPLNSMSLQLDMLEDDIMQFCKEEGRGEVNQRFSAIVEQVQRLDRLTQKYLNVGHTSVDQYKKIDIHALIEKSVSFLSTEFQAQEIRLDLDFKASQAEVIGDEDALSQVLFNLLRNSLEALGNSNEVKDKVLRITTLNHPNQELSIRISDNGPGVPLELRSRIFEPFVTSKATGHGLGLSVSRRICIEHGGELKLVAEEEFVDRREAGASFEFVLPCEEKKGEHFA